MGKYVGLTAVIAENMIEGSAFKANGETVTISEEKMNAAKAAMSEAVRGMMRDFWTIKEADEDSLESLDGEVKIEELMDKTNDGTGSVPSLGESLSFDIKAIVEGLMDEEPEMDTSPQDGDEDFQNAGIGHDDAQMGGDLEQDGGIDSDPAVLGGDDVVDPDMGGDIGGDIGGDDLGDDTFADLSFADLASPEGDVESDMSDDLGDDLATSDELGGDEIDGETPIKNAMESAQPLARVKGGSKAKIKARK